MTQYIDNGMTCLLLDDGTVGLHSWLNGADCSCTCKRNSHLVDPADSHMLVSKIKPCMS